MSGYDPYLYMMSPNGGFSGSGFEQTNPYSAFQSGPIPPTSWGGGTPNNALGQPIASYHAPQPVYTPPTPGTPGTTLNNAGLGANSLGAALDFGMFGQPSALSGMGSGNPSMGGYNPYMVPEQIMGFIPQQGGSQGSPGSPGGWSTPNNWQAFLQARANPGRVTTPGVQPPAGGPQYQPGQGVFPALAQQWQATGQVRPGIGINTNFMNALQNLQGRGT